MCDEFRQRICSRPIILRWVKKKHFSLDFSLILCSAEVALGTSKPQLVMLTKVAVPSAPAPAGQERAITALWLQYDSSRQPPGDGPIEIPLQAPSWQRQRRSPPPRCLTGPLTQPSDFKRQTTPQMRCVMWVFGRLICVGGWRIYSCRPPSETVPRTTGTLPHRDGL